MIDQTSPRLAATTRSLFFPYGSCVVKATSLFFLTIRGNCYTIGKSCACHCTNMTRYSSCYNLFYFLGMCTCCIYTCIYLHAKLYGMSDFLMKFHSSSHHRWMISDYLASSVLYYLWYNDSYNQFMDSHMSSVQCTIS